MDTTALVIVLAVVALVALDLLALRFGHDSRSHGDRPNWW
jgi:hypothetical protein